MSEYLRIKKTRILDVNGDDWTFSVNGMRIMLNELELARSSVYSASTLKLFVDFLASAEAGILHSKWTSFHDKPPPDDTLIMVINELDVWNSVSAMRYFYANSHEVRTRWTHWAPFPRWPA